MKTAPVVPADAPVWYQAHGSDIAAVIENLLREIARLQARLKAAGIT